MHQLHLAAEEPAGTSAAEAAGTAAEAAGTAAEAADSSSEELPAEEQPAEVQPEVLQVRHKLDNWSCLAGSQPHIFHKTYESSFPVRVNLIYIFFRVAYLVHILNTKFILV